MKVLAIDTSCDETSAAVTKGLEVLSNVVWSQASLHAKWGGVVPSLAQRQHEERIDWVVARALKTAEIDLKEIGTIAVTVGPGLAIALGVGIKKAKELASDLKLPILGINHIEGHILSCLAKPKSRDLTSPGTGHPLLGYRRGEQSKAILGLAVSGAHTEVILIEELASKYKILAETQDDALGEALDKTARMLGLGYPGGAVLEKMARLGNQEAYTLPLPMIGKEKQLRLSYSGLKTAMWRLVESQGADLDKKQICDLAASFQSTAFEHLVRICREVLKQYPAKEIWVGGGVVANLELRRRLRKMGKELKIAIRFPYSMKLCGDNAAMIGVVAGIKIAKENFEQNIDLVDRQPRFRIDEFFGVEDGGNTSGLGGV